MRFSRSPISCVAQTIHITPVTKHYNTARMNKLLWVTIVAAVALFYFLFCSPHSNDRLYYSTASRGAFQRAVDLFLEPHNHFIVDAHSKLALIFEDASSQGVQEVLFWSKISEVGFTTLAILQAEHRWEDLVAHLLSMDEKHFGRLLADYNTDLFANYSPRNGGVLCTFAELMKTGICSYQGKSFAIPNFKIEDRRNHFASSAYKFCTGGEMESKINISRNLQLLADNDAPSGNPQLEDARREHLYNHTEAFKMFRFAVSFDGVEQPKYSEPGQAVCISKLMHWDLTFKLWRMGMFEKGYKITVAAGNLKGNGFHDAHTNPSAFDGFPAHFAQSYERLGHEDGVLNAFVVKVNLWDGDHSDHFLKVFKNDERWRTVGQKTRDEEQLQ